MAFKIEVDCYKCGNIFVVEENTFPLQEEGGLVFPAICPECETNCGDILIHLDIK